MASTLTASTWLRQPIKLESGVAAVAGTVQYNGATVSASHIVFLAKVPNGATITDGYIAGTSPNAQDTWKVGITGSETALSAAATLSATAQRVSFIKCPVKVSLSDSANPQYVTVYLTHNAGTDTATGSLSFKIEYVSNSGAGGI